MAARADRHLALLPGTDVVLALAVARHLTSAGLLDEAFLAAHANGVDEHLAAAQPWTLPRAAEVCGVPADAIAAFAEAYAERRPSFLRVGWGIERNRNGGAGFRAVLALPVLAGHFGATGSGVMTSLSDAAPLSLRRADPDGRQPTPDRRQVNMNHLGRLLCGELDGPAARVLFVSGANPAVMSPDQTRVLRGLARDDLFTVVHDQVLTDTAALADVVLPCTTHFEADDIAHSYGSYTLQRMPPADRAGRREPHERRGRRRARRPARVPGRLVRPRPRRRCSSGWSSTAAGPKGRGCCASLARRCSSPRCSRRSPTAGPGSTIPAGQVPAPSTSRWRAQYPLTLDQPGDQPHDQLDPRRGPRRRGGAGHQPVRRGGPAGDRR